MNIENGIALYINLSSSKKRNKSIKNTLKQLSIDYKRINAIANPIVTLGQLKSHVKAITYVKNYLLKLKNYDWYLFLEDDVILNNDLSVDYIKKQVNKVNEYIKEAPILLLNNSSKDKDIEVIEHNHFSELFYTNGYNNSSIAYIVKKNYIAKLLNEFNNTLLLFELNISKRVQGIAPENPIWFYDINNIPWLELQKKDKWLVFKKSILVEDTLESDKKKLSNALQENYYDKLKLIK